MRKLNLFFLFLVFIAYPILFWSRMNVVDVSVISVAPNWSYLGGTDSLGRDYLLRCIQGTYMSVLISLFSMVLAHLIGFIIGSLSVLKVFKVSVWLPRCIDLLDALPSYLVVSVLALFWQSLFRDMDLIIKSIISLILSISLVSWMSIARIVRLEILQILEKEFILSSKLLGASFYDLIQTHFFKFTIDFLKTSVIQHLPHFILLESFLSYLGIGIVPPYLSLGGLISEGWKLAFIKPLLFLVPSFFLVLISVEFKRILRSLKG